MNFEELSFEELDQHAMENLVFDDEEVSPILKGHIFIEKVLETLISKSLANPDAIFKRTRTFDLKADLALAMGLIDEVYYSAFKAINKVRNNYAHKHVYKVSIEELSGFKFNWEEIQNQAFEGACTKGAGEEIRTGCLVYYYK
ncbi:MAG: hypothetical protein ABW157_18285 [Candidatus Thiodiazotropha sp. LLP2]